MAFVFEDDAPSRFVFEDEPESGGILNTLKQAGKAALYGFGEASGGALEGLASTPTEREKLAADLSNAGDSKVRQADALIKTFSQPLSVVKMAGEELAGAFDRATGLDKPKAKVEQTLKDIGKSTYEYWNAKANEAEKQAKLEPYSPSWWTFQTARVMGDMAPMLATAIATKSPNAGLGVMGAQVFGRSFGQARQEGKDDVEATRRAIFDVAAEVIPERIPLGILTKEGTKFFSRVMKSAGAEGAQELFTEVLQAGYDYGIIDPQTSWGEAAPKLKAAWESGELPTRLAVAPALGAMAGGGLAVASHPFVGGEQTDQEQPTDTRSLEDLTAEEPTAAEPAPPPVASGIQFAPPDAPPIAKPMVQLVQEKLAARSPEARLYQQAGMVSPYPGGVNFRPPETALETREQEAARLAGARESGLPYAPPSLAMESPVDEATRTGISVEDLPVESLAAEDIDSAPGLDVEDLRVPPADLMALMPQEPVAIPPVGVPTEGMDVGEADTGDFIRRMARERGTEPVTIPPVTDLDRELIAELRRAEGIEEPRNGETLQAQTETPVAFEPIKGNRFVVKTDNPEAVKKLRALKGAVVSKTAGGVVIPAAQRPAAEALLGAKPEVFDARLSQDRYKQALKGMAGQAIKGGGVAYIRDERGDIVGRTASLNPAFIQGMIADRTIGSVKEFKALVEKAVNGEKLTPRQQGVIRQLLDMEDMEAEAAALEDRFHEYMASRPDEQVEGFGEPEYSMDELVSKASRVDEDAAMSILERGGSDARIALDLIKLIESRNETQRVQQDQPQDRRQGAEEAPEDEAARRQEVESSEGLFSLARKYGDTSAVGNLFTEDGKPAQPVTEQDVAEDGVQKPVGTEARAAPGKIVDVGEKIGGARKDTAVSTGQRKPKATETEEPGWRKRYTVQQIVKSANVDETGKWVIRDQRNKDWTGQARRVGREVYDTQAAAEAAIPLVEVSRNHSAAYRTENGESFYEIVRNVTDRKRVTVVPQRFKTREDALRYMAEHAAEIIDTRTSFGEEILPRPDHVVRKGVERRKGNVKAEDFKETFGFRGVEFGNWEAQDERQTVMNHAYDGLLDLAEMLGIPPKAIGLNGELGLAFGARGHGLSGARAHYERNYGVINLTKMKGAGSLAHEWFHSLDHYFGRQDTKAKSERVANERGDMVFPSTSPSADYVSHGFKRTGSGVREELRAAYTNLIQTMFSKAEKYVQDVQKVDEFTGRSRADLEKALTALRQDLAMDMTKHPQYGKYYEGKRNTKPASAEQLAAFDEIAAKIIAGESLETEHRLITDGKKRRSILSGGRWTNDTLEKLSEIYKAVRGRSGFDSTNRNGVLDGLRDKMALYSQRLKMLADAQKGEEKTKRVPTAYAMAAKSIDQGRASEYWTTPHEMAARAFEAYTHDKIKEGGGQSDFLVYGTNTAILTPWGWERPYPHGDERVAINKAFDTFVGALQTKDTEKGVALFSLENQTQRADTSRTEITSDEALERFRDSLQAVGIPREAIAPGNLRADTARAIAALGDLIGRRIVVFRNTNPLKFNASGFVHNADNSVIYLDQNASRNYLAIVGHEFLHTLKAEHSDLYRQFLRDTVDVLDAKELEAMIGKLEKRRASYGLEPLPRSVAIEEAVADFFGDQFMDRKFWEETAARNPSMMQRIAKAFADWINAMIARVRRGNDTGKLFFDLQKARAAAASVLAEHMKRTPSKAETEGGKFSLSGKDQTQTPAFKRWFKDSKVVDAQGRPMLVYHSGMFDENEDGVPIVNGDGFHFGTITAAEIRDFGKRVDDFIKDIKTTQGENEDGESRWYWESQYIDSYDFNPDGYETSEDAKEAAEQFAIEQDFSDTDPMPITEAYLSIQNPKRVRDQHGDWKATVAKAKSQGYDGLVYRNEYEDKGKDSWVAFYPTQIKSINNTGAFDPKNPDIRFSIEGQVRDPQQYRFERAERGYLSGIPQKSNGEAGFGIYAYESSNRSMRDYYTKNGEDRIGITPKRNAVILDLTTKDARAAIVQEAKKIAPNGKTTATASTIQRHPWAIRSYIAKQTSAPVDAYLVPHAGSGIPSGRQLVIVNEEAFEFSSISTPDIRFSLEDRTDTVGRARGVSAAKQQQLVQGLPAGQPVTWTYDTSRWEGWRGKLRKAREYTQDKLVSVLYAQEDIEKVRGALEDNANVHRRENLMHGRVGARLDLLEKTQTRPLWNAIRKAGLAPELVEDYLEARHAEERNAHVAKINPDMPDGGSGLTNAEAQAFLTGKDKGLRSGKKLDAVTKAKLEAIAKRVDAISQQTRNILVSSGLITQEQKAAMEAAYKTYVPLRGKDGVDVGFERRATGKGIDVRGKPVQRALGRGEGNRAQNILAEIIGDAERVIVQAEKARVGRTAVKLALENPNPDLWEVEPVEVEQKFSEATEQVYWGVRNLMNDPETLIVPFQGKKYNLYLKDPQIRDALKNLGVEQMPAYLRWLGGLNRYFSAILTRYNPSFTAINMLRDANLGFTGLASEHGAKIAAKAAKNYFAAMRGLWRESRGKEMSGKWQKAAREFEEAGGKTYFHRYENVEDIQRRIASEFRGFWELAREGKLGTAMGKTLGDNPLVKAIEDANDVVENTLRLSAYQTLREEGMSIEKAAEYAKNMTVNFSRRGSATSVLNSFYLFYNASSQGITRTLQLMKQPKVQATLGSLAGLQFVLALLAMGMEDDDGEPLWNTIPEWEKQRNLVFPIPAEKDGKRTLTVYKLPMPYGFNIFPYIGGRMAQLFSDLTNGQDVKAADIANDIGAAMGQSLSPIPINEGWQAFLPEILKIANAISSNKDDLGIPITKEQPYSKYDIPRSSLGKASTPEAFKTVSKTLNRLGGGDDYTPPKVLKSLLDWSPEDLQFLFNTFTGGIGSTGGQAVGLVEKTISGLEVGPRDVPILRSLVSNVDTKRATANLYYERVDVIERELARVRDAAKDGDKTPLDAAKDPDIAAGFNVIAKKKKGEMDVTIKAKSGSLFDAYKEASKAVSEINKDIQKVYAGTLPFTERKREIDRLQKEREEAMKAMNAAWNAMKRGRSELELQ